MGFSSTSGFSFLRRRHGARALPGAFALRCELRVDIDPAITMPGIQGYKGSVAVERLRSLSRRTD
jgi:hypothetical protein